MNALITDLQPYYSDFLTGDLSRLDDFYHRDLVFADPLHRIEGLDTAKQYFASMRDGLLRCQFEFGLVTVAADSACLPWQMHYAHRALNGGRPLSLRGCSLLRFNQRIHYHEDFYDLGAMVYEQVPLLGALVRGVKSRLAGQGN